MTQTIDPHRGTLLQRAYWASILREAKRLQRRWHAATGDHYFPVGVFFHGVMASIPPEEFRPQWKEDMANQISPLNFSREARRKRAARRLVIGGEHEESHRRRLLKRIGVVENG